VATFHSIREGSRIDWFRPAPAEAIAKKDVLAMAHFPLVPFSGRIRDARLRFAGREYTLPNNVPWERNTLHGDGWQRPWRVVSQSGNRVEMELAHDGSWWPWRTLARQRFELGEGRLEISLSLTNQSDEAMPAGIGLHPWFPASAGVRLTARAGKVFQVDKGNLFTEVTPVPPRWDFSRGLSLAGTNLNNGFSEWDGLAVIDWPEWRARMTIEASAQLSHLVVYTPPGESYFCAEPVSHSVDAFNLEAAGVSGNGTMVLKPGETLSGSARFSGER
jgi:aldose 1-epimerase